LTGSELAVVIDGRRRTFVVAETDGGLWLAGGGTWHVREVAEVSVRGDDAHAGDAEIASPMPGAVIAVNVESGAAVSAGQALVVVEAMKMEHSLTSPIDGTVEVLVRQGDQVMVDQILARVVPTAEADTAEEDTENTTQKEEA
jgi:acetyl-CoA/propionyl-CoA carboxylase biotin carboxyl carrier protein